jgi:nucleoside-diphosphate-sugar epimerase
MNKETKIYISGHNGMVGSAIWRALEKKGYNNLIGKSSKELDLRNQQAVINFYKKEQPEVVIDAAAKVGGILAEVDLLVGDPTKANTKLGWTPEYDLKYLVKDMMSSDIKLMKQDQYLKDGGYKTLNFFE